MRSQCTQTIQYIGMWLWPTTPGLLSAFFVWFNRPRNYTKLPGHISANTRTHQLCCDHKEMGTTISSTETQSCRSPYKWSSILNAVCLVQLSSWFSKTIATSDQSQLSHVEHSQDCQHICTGSGPGMGNMITCISLPQFQALPACEHKKKIKRKGESLVIIHVRNVTSENLITRTNSPQNKLWKLYGWQNGTRWHYTTLPGSMVSYGERTQTPTFEKPR